MRRRRAAAVAVALVLALTACGGGDDAGGAGGAEEPDETVPSTTTTSTTVPASSVAVGPLLVNEADLGPEGFTTEIVGRPFSAEEASRIRLCGQDLRTELGIDAGRQSRFRDEGVEVSHTVTVGGDAEALVDRFAELTETCPTAWTEPPLPTGGGPIEREITGAYPLPDDLAVPAAAAVIRSTNDRGATDTIVVVLASGPVVSSLSVSGPVGADFEVVDPAVAAAARRLTAL